MNQSAEITELAPAIVAAQAAGLVVVAKNANTQTNSKYADLADIAAAVLPVLAEHHIAVLQFVGAIRSEAASLNVGQSKVTGPMLVVGLTTRIQHSSGQWMEQVGEFPLAPPPVSKAGNEILNWSQTYGLTLTYARRYALVAALGIAVGDDGDAQRLMSALREPTGPAEPQYDAHWTDFILGKWDGELIDGYKMPLGEMSDDDKSVLVKEKLYLKSPALTACIWDRADRMLHEKGLRYEDCPPEFPGDFRKLDHSGVKRFFNWASTAPADQGGIP
jgi:hypothetical protein